MRKLGSSPGDANGDANWQTDRPGPPRRQRWRSPSAAWAGSHRPARRLREPGSIGRSPLEGNVLGSVRIGTSEGTATLELAAELGIPSDRPTSGCTGPFRDVEWHDLIVQFTNGRFTGYHYWLPQPHAALDPRLKTQRGITLGSVQCVATHVHPYADGRRLLERARSDVRSVRLAPPTERWCTR
jgi:hypothetical protein